ncbi:MAG: NUDIX hydrolase [Proteobacteria bacterium]|nr:NUDIX hydrolase [Pseudomonadota bacterium]
MTTPVTPLLTVDAVIELPDRDGCPIVVIERKHPPLGLALPGGFVDVGETVEAAVMRESDEEVGLKIDLKGVLGVFSDPARDVRGHTVSIVYVATATGEPAAADDAAEVFVVNPDELLVESLVFDHAKIIGRYRLYRQGGIALLPAVSLDP